MKINSSMRDQTWTLAAVLAIGLTFVFPSQAESEPTGLAASYLSGLHAQATADPAAAANYFDQALAIDPGNRTIMFRAFFQKAQSGDIDGALPYAKSAYADRPSLSVAPLLMAIDHYKNGEFQDAQTLIEGIPGRSTIGLALPLLRAWAKAPTDNHTEALSALAPYEGRKEWRVLSATMSAMLNEFYDRDEAALVYYRALAANVDNQPLSILRLATNGLHRLGYSDEAVKAVENFREKRGGSALWDGYLNQYEDPEQTPPVLTAQMGMAEALYAITRIRMSSARRSSGLTLAIVYAHMALYLNPDLDVLRREVADAMSARQQYQPANEMLRAIGPDDPGYLIAQLRLAENLEREDRTDEAIEMLEDLARRRPNFPEPLVTVGDILRNRERFEEAVDFYDRAFSRYPDGEPDGWALYYTRGMALERAQKWKRAEKDFKKALQLSPEQAQVLNYLGYSWLDRGENVSEARRMIELAVSQRPEDGYIVDSLGWAMYLMGEYGDAVVQLERAVTLNTSDPTINEHLGDAYWTVGRETEARFQWRRALSMEPDEEQSEELRAKLQRGLARN
ncbi:MAG: tetratricopeptide repeat protein [Rhodospirillaceae bacterium]|nr:tetratricopeptide repeat protein [Rhodospirillaceae bacterium]